ncbi:hypothetical protein LPC08_14400 [Roseomonas sp. OT10]|uniref:class I SAM-dependent methyltransferase n=1 Tax=Roseomonas cutis TaxID=2897332 RepID=UPI001E5B3388|nr:class I SAM-dependent methyltransferase [Roseomonas sp. OT10]UFN47217.1 hypothetical protein LPC08_14400 [Roseomonas sp. OT10]
MSDTAAANPYDRSFFDAQASDSLQSARAVLPELFRYACPDSVLDVGCGVATWLRVAGEMGVQDRLGVDGDYVDRTALMVPEELFLPVDLAQPGLTDAVTARHPQRFDLVMCLEVAEHLPFERSAGVVQELCALGDLILFSAAIPFQQGTGHINEQWPEFWATLFRDRGYACFDPLRPRIWGQPGVDWWYAQNLLVFAREESEAFARMPAAAATGRAPLARVHPAAWLSNTLNTWHVHRAAAREEEPQDFRAVLRAWSEGARTPPPLRALERARMASRDARDVFPYTRTETDSPEQRINEAEAARQTLEASLSAARHECDMLRQDRDAHQVAAEGLRRDLAELDELRQEGARLRTLLGQAKVENEAARFQVEAAGRRVTVLQNANVTLRGIVARHEAVLAEAGELRQELRRVNDALARAGTENNNLRVQLTTAEMARAQVEALVASTSWRITRPLRAVRRLLG